MSSQSKLQTTSDSNNTNTPESKRPWSQPNKLREREKRGIIRIVINEFEKTVIDFAKEVEKSK